MRRIQGTEGMEKSVELRGRNSRPGVLHDETEPSTPASPLRLRPRHLNADRAFGRELDGVVQEGAKDAAIARLVALELERFGELRLEAQLKVFGLRGAGDSAQSLARRFDRAEGGAAQFEATTLETHEIKQVVNEAREAYFLLGEVTNQILWFRWEACLAEGAGQAADCGEGGAELVADEREELLLAAVGARGTRAGLFQLLRQPGRVGAQLLHLAADARAGHPLVEQPARKDQEQGAQTEALEGRQSGHQVRRTFSCAETEERNQEQ